MLQETLEAMRDKIKAADEKWEQENDGATIERFEKQTRNDKWFDE